MSIKKDYFILLILNVAINAGMGIIIPVLPNLLKSFGFVSGALAVPFVSLVLARVVAKPYTGRLLTIFSPKILLCFSFFLYMLVFWLYQSAESKEMFILIRVLEGLVEGVASVVLVDVTMRMTNHVPEERGKYMGYFAASFGIGFLIGPSIGTFALKMGGMHLMFMSGSLMALLALGLTSILTFKDVTTPAASNGRKAKNTVAVLIQFRNYLPIYSPNILRRALFFSFMIIVPLYAHEKLGISEDNIGLLFILSAIITSSLMPIAGKFSDRNDPWKITLFTLLVMGASICCFSLVNNIIYFSTLYAIETIAFAFMLPASNKIFADHVGKLPERPQIVGAFSSFVEMSTLVLAVVIPFSYNISPLAAFGFLGGVTILSALPFLSSKVKAEEIRKYAAS